MCTGALRANSLGTSGQARETAAARVLRCTTSKYGCTISKQAMHEWPGPAGEELGGEGVGAHDVDPGVDHQRLQPPLAHK